MNAGQGNIQNLGQIQSVNGNENYNIWADSDCDKIRGGDGSFMSPSMSMKTKLEITVVDLCRTIRLVPEKPVKVGHLNALRFLPDPNLWNYEHSDNFCYCPKQNEESKTEVIEEESSDDFGFSWFDGEEIEAEKTQQKVIEKEAKCKGNGLYHVGPCKFGAPLVTSWPHFFKTEPQIKTVTGLNPDADKHQFFMDFQPQMGIGMRAYVRLQFNLKMEKSAAFVQTSNLPFSESHIVPVMWFEDVIEQPPESLQLLLKDALDTGPSLALNSTIVAFTGLFMQICLYIVFVLWSYHKDN